MKSILTILLLLLSTTVFAKDWAEPVRPDCGGWENYMQVVVTQMPDPEACNVSPKTNRYETCYTVTIFIYPTSDPECRWDFNVPQRTVKQVVKDFMDAYLP